MSLLTLILTFVVVGFILWLVNTYVPMEGTVKRIMNAVVAILLVVWILQGFGLIGSLSRFHVG